MFWTYILECEDGSLYTGIAKDIDQRFIAHVAGKGARYTRSHDPMRVVYREAFPTMSAAAKREAQIKRWKRAKKLALIQSGG